MAASGRAGPIIAAILLSLLSSRASHAHHYNRGHFVTAYAPCPSETANTATADGVAACSPPVPASDCAAQPDTALQLGPDGKTSFLMQATGRRRTRINDGVAIETRILLRGVKDCNGTPYRGDLKARIVLRLHSDDPACATGRCTLPDLAYTHTLSCRGAGACRARADSNSAFVEQGLPPLPLGYGYSAEVVTFEVHDRAGIPFLATGLSLGDDVLPTIAGTNRAWRWLARLDDILSPSVAHAYGANGTGPSDHLFARYVRSFAPCASAATNTTTSDGRPACAAIPQSDCASDPDNAVVPVVPSSGNFSADTKGRGKVDIALKGNGQFLVAGYLRNLKTCSGAGYSGALTAEGTFRTTLRDSACSGGTCTTVDGPLLRAPVGITDGSATISDAHPFDELLGPSYSSSFSAQVIGVRFLDRSGNSVLTGPSLLVRCNDQDGETFCFGN